MTTESIFKDAANPTPEEMTAWAFAPHVPAPYSQDWDVIATRPDLGPLFVTLAADAGCPRRHFFLVCLYLLSGDAVRTDYRTMPKRHLLDLTRDAGATGEPWLTTWASRTAGLVRTPASFSYSDWCEPFGLASRPVAD